MTKQFVLQSCFLYITNLMAYKGFNFFDECAARCVHLFPQKEECTPFSSASTVKCTHLAEKLNNVK